MPVADRKSLNARIDPALHRQVKVLAVRQSKSIEELVEEALRLLLARYRKES